MLRQAGWVVLCLLFAVGVFAVSIALSSVWAYVWVIWLLLGITGWLLYLLPRLRGQSALSWISLLYGSGFILLWLLSSDRLRYSETAEKVFAILTLVLPVAIVVSALVTLGWYGRATDKLREPARWLLLTFTFGLLVAYFSGNTGSADPMLQLMRSLGLSEPAAGSAVFIIRKTIHFLFYGGFAWVAYRTAYVAGARAVGAVTFALPLVLSHAAFDEFRQASLTRRTGNPLDFILDAGGAVFFVWLAARAKK